jgi:hypothetical protein
MSEGIPEHAAQALVETGHATSDKAMDATVARIARVHIFPKVKFAVDADFVAKGKIYKVCCRKFVKGGGGNKEFFEEHWSKKNGWKIVRSTINSKRNSVQDSIRKHAKKCKEFVFPCCFLIVGIDVALPKSHSVALLHHPRQ